MQIPTPTFQGMGGELMGDHGYNAGGYAYMERVRCPDCGCNRPLGHRRISTGDISCQSKEKCLQRQKRRREKESLGRAKEAARLKRKPLIGLCVIVCALALPAPLGAQITVEPSTAVAPVHLECRNAFGDAEPLVGFSGASPNWTSDAYGVTVKQTTSTPESGRQIYTLRLTNSPGHQITYLNIGLPAVTISSYAKSIYVGSFGGQALPWAAGWSELWPGPGYSPLVVFRDGAGAFLSYSHFTDQLIPSRMFWTVSGDYLKPYVHYQVFNAPGSEVVLKIERTKGSGDLEAACNAYRTKALLPYLGRLGASEGSFPTDAPWSMGWEENSFLSDIQHVVDHGSKGHIQWPQTGNGWHEPLPTRSAWFGQIAEAKTILGARPLGCLVSFAYSPRLPVDAPHDTLRVTNEDFQVLNLDLSGKAPHERTVAHHERLLAKLVEQGVSCAYWDVGQMVGTDGLRYAARWKRVGVSLAAENGGDVMAAVTGLHFFYPMPSGDLQFAKQITPGATLMVHQHYSNEWFQRAKDLNLVPVLTPAQMTEWEK